MRRPRRRQQQQQQRRRRGRGWRWRRRRPRGLRLLQPGPGRSVLGGPAPPRAARRFPHGAPAARAALRGRGARLRAARRPQVYLQVRRPAAPGPRPAAQGRLGARRVRGWRGLRGGSGAWLPLEPPTGPCSACSRARHFLPGSQPAARRGFRVPLGTLPSSPFSTEVSGPGSEHLLGLNGGRTCHLCPGCGTLILTPILFPLCLGCEYSRLLRVPDPFENPCPHPSNDYLSTRAMVGNNPPGER